MQRNVYTVTVPRLGAAPTIDVSNPEGAAFPVRRLTDVGGEFPVWSADGRTVHWSLGNAWFSYDLDEARAFEERREAAEAEDEAAEDESAAADDPADAGPDEDADAGGGADDSDKANEGNEEDEFRATEVRVVIDAARDLPDGVAVLRGARAITMNDGEVIDDADIVVRGPRIEAVGPRGTVDVPSEAVVIDVSGRTVAPGFVDNPRAPARARRDPPHRRLAVPGEPRLRGHHDPRPATRRPATPRCCPTPTWCARGRCSAPASTPPAPASSGRTASTARTRRGTSSNPHDDAKLRRFVPHDEIDARTLRRGQWFRDEVHVFERHARFVRDLVEAGGAPAWAATASSRGSGTTGSCGRWPRRA